MGDGKIVPMKPSLQKLQKFFRLEAERGYDNRAVLGGLDRSWTTGSRRRVDKLPEELIQVIHATAGLSASAQPLEQKFQPLADTTGEEHLILHSASRPRPQRPQWSARPFRTTSSAAAS
jgi:hypothetical protein